MYRSRSVVVAEAKTNVSVKSSSIARQQKPMKISAPFSTGARRPVFSVLQTNTNAANSTKLRINGNQGKFITRPLGGLGSGRKRAIDRRFQRTQRAKWRDLHTSGNVILIRFILVFQRREKIRAS